MGVRNSAEFGRVLSEIVQTLPKLYLWFRIRLTYLIIYKTKRKVVGNTIHKN